MAPPTTHSQYPPFPRDVRTASLVGVSLRDLRSSPTASSASEKLFTACQNLGFFYLDLTNDLTGEQVIREAEELNALQQQFFALPHEVKDEYGMDKMDPFFSYRWTQCPQGVLDIWGRQGRREMYNLRTDDLLGIRPALPRHAMISSAETLISSFARNCREVVRLLLSILETHLRLPPGGLLNLHHDNLPSGDFVSLQHRAFEPSDQAMIEKGEHTDFGSITLLFNWLGGLQIREQAGQAVTSGEWLYVKPIPGSCIVNIGDSLSKCTSGLLKTNVHRVAPSPGLHAGLPRYSLVYFAHPNDDVELKPVKGGLVDDASPGKNDLKVPITASDWVVRRSLGDLRGVYTHENGIELRVNDDAVAVPGYSKIKA